MARAMAFALGLLALKCLFFFASADLQVFEHPIKGDGSLSLLAVGDWGRNGTFNQSQVAYQMGRVGEDLDLDFVISVGDNFYENGLTDVNDKEFENSFTEIYAAKSLQKQWYSVLGNHDYRGNVLAQLDPILRKIDDRWLCMRSFVVDAGNKEAMGRVGEDLDLDFVISVGDNFYENGLTDVNDKEFENSFSKIYAAKSLQKQWYSVLGNHDYRGNVLAQLDPILRKIDDRWLCMRSFVVDAEIAQFFFVDTTPFVKKYWHHPKKNHYDWRGVAPRRKYISSLLKDLDLALQESTATWKIVVGHHTIRSVSEHGDTAELVDMLLPMLERYGVDFYINGHDHCLEHISSHSSPLQFVTTGGGSKAWRGVYAPTNEKLQLFYDGQGFISLQLTNDEAKVMSYDVFGNILHRWSRTKQLNAFA